MLTTPEVDDLIKKMRADGKDYDQIAAHLKEVGHRTRLGTHMKAAAIRSRVYGERYKAKKKKAPKVAALPAANYKRIETPPALAPKAVAEKRLVFMMGTPEQIRAVIAGGGL